MPARYRQGLPGSDDAWSGHATVRDRLPHVAHDGPQPAEVPNRGNPCGELPGSVPHALHGCVRLAHRGLGHEVGPPIEAEMDVAVDETRG